MLSFLNDTPVETPCTDFFRNLPKTAFTDNWLDTDLQEAIQAPGCTYGDQTVGDKERWVQTIGAEMLCASVLEEALHFCLQGENLALSCSQPLKMAIIHGMNTEIQQTGLNTFANKVENDFMCRKILLAYKQKPEVVVTSFPTAHFMYQVKNIPHQIHSAVDNHQFRCNLFTTETEAERHFAILYSHITQQRFNIPGNTYVPISRELLERINNLLDYAPCSTVPARTVCERQTNNKIRAQQQEKQR